MADRRPRRIVCAAMKLDGLVVCGARHFDRLMHRAIEAIDEHAPQSRYWARADQGFVDQYGDFHNRVDALAIAIDAGQLEGRKKTAPSHELFSEDLY